MKEYVNLPLAVRHSDGPGKTTARADEIMRAEVNL